MDAKRFPYPSGQRAEFGEVLTCPPRIGPMLDSVFGPRGDENAQAETAQRRADHQQAALKPTSISPRGSRSARSVASSKSASTPTTAGESFNGKLRDELLNREIFSTLKEAQVLVS